MEITSHNMIYTREQRQSAYKKLPPYVRDLIMSNETTELITTVLKEVGLSEEQSNLADSEILYAMFCLQSLSEAINNIAKLSKKSVNDLAKVKSVIQDNIFSKYKINVREYVEANKSQPIAPPPTLEVAPKNLPMVEKGEVAHEVSPVKHPPAPKPEPPKEIVKPEQGKAPLPDYRYAEGKDPYREPLT